MLVQVLSLPLSYHLQILSLSPVLFPYFLIVSARIFSFSVLKTKNGSNSKEKVVFQVIFYDDSNAEWQEGHIEEMKGMRWSICLITKRTIWIENFILKHFFVTTFFVIKNFRKKLKFVMTERKMKLEMGFEGEENLSLRRFQDVETCLKVDAERVRGSVFLSLSLSLFASPFLLWYRERERKKFERPFTP